MNVQQVMTKTVNYIPADTTLQQASRLMRDQGCGFLPIGDDNSQKLQGVVTDRDIVVRAIADGRNPETTTVDAVKTDKVLYCYQNDSLEAVSNSMSEQQIYRLIVLDDAENKRLCGIVSLGDIARNGLAQLTGQTATAIAA